MPRMIHDVSREERPTDNDPAKVYCGACEFFDAHVPDGEANCHHPHARLVEDTYEHVQVLWVPADVRNAHNDCADFTLMRSRWKRHFRYHPVDACLPWVLFMAVPGIVAGLVWLAFQIWPMVP
jgi:hypothetical protein